MQTLASFFLPRNIALPPAEERRVEVAPGVELLCMCHWQTERRGPMTVIVVHGLEGSSDSQYMRGIAAKALAAGMNVVRVNQRNCGNTDRFSPTLYNSGLSGDIRAVAEHFLERDGISQFVLAGFSMGGNLVLKLAGEWGSAAPAEFRGVVGVCPAMDLAVGADALHEPANRIYEYYFLVNLTRRFRRKVRLFPQTFDPERLRGVRTLRQFDDRVTAFYCGYTGADDYYARAAASNVVDRIAVPARILHAASDPFVRFRTETLAKTLGNPNIEFVESEDGGHCAFIGVSDAGYDGRWAEREVVEFARERAK